MALVDQYGRPIDTGLLAEPQTADTAWLVREFENHPAKGLTPVRLAGILQAAEQGDWLGQLDLADDIEERDGHCYAELAKRRGSIAALAGDVVEPKGATAAEKKWTEQLREWLAELPDFEDTLLEMMEGVLKGSACHEIVWRQQGRVRLPELSYTPARWFVPDATRKGLLLRSATQMAPPPEGMPDLPPVMGEPLRPLAWMVHTPRSRNGYLARSSLVRVLAWPYLFKHYSIRDLQEFLEIYGLPLRLGQYPAGASPEEKMTLLRAVTEIGHNAAGIIPQGMKVDFQHAAAGTQVPFESMIRYMDAVQSKVILGQTLTSGEGQHGTQALGNVHEKVRMDIRAADARQIEGSITRQLLIPMGILNIPGFDARRAPAFKLDLGEGEDVAAYAEALPKLASAGLRIKVSWAHEKLRIPMAEDGEEVLKGAAAPVPVAGAPGGNAPNDEEELDDEEERDPGQRPPPRRPPPRRTAPLAGRVPPASAPSPAPSPTRDAIDELVDEQAAQWRPLLGPMVAPLLAELNRAAASGESLAAFAARLPELVGSLDTSALADDLARAAFAARLAGEADLGLAGGDS